MREVIKTWNVDNWIEMNVFPKSIDDESKLAIYKLS